MRRSLKVLLALAAIFGATAINNQLETSKAARTYPPLGEKITTGGVELHYFRRGAGRPVVLLHGNPGSVEDWAMAVMPELQQTHLAIAFDRPGHGHSQAAPDDSGSPEVQARLIHGAVVALGIERPILVGHSWG